MLFLRIGITLFALVSLTACTPETAGRWLRTQSGAVADVSRTARDSVELGKLSLERAKENIREAQEAVAEAQERLRKAEEGFSRLKEAVTGSGS